MLCPWFQGRALPWFLLIAAGWIQTAGASVSPSPETLAFQRSPHQVRLLLSEIESQFEVRGYDLQWAAAGSLLTKGPRAFRADRATRWQLRCFQGLLTVRELEGKARVFSTRGAMRVASPAGFVFLDGVAVREELLLGPGKSGCRVVNVLDLEKYVEGIVNAEFNSRWNADSVSAQVIAARTYALYQMRAARKAGRDYDLKVTIHDQVYGGAAAEDAASARAVRRTRGMVLVASTGKGRAPASPAPIKAFYHSSCGGLTELPERVWGGPYSGYRRASRCPFCKGAPKEAWKLRLTEKDLREALRLGAKRDGLEPGWPLDWHRRASQYRLHRVRVTPWKESPRAREIALVWRHPAGLKQGWMELKLPATRLRSWVGPARLLSTRFDASSARDGSWLLEGRGNGHGVGLCQWGAKRMGEKGNRAAAILAHYYPDARVAKLW
ncbi:MAG: SpoIID/LytB domain-containing protein [Bdellovibrionales bacterium]|nr:SpoIID/LytB domain-containing protein [Bdellovibrionales bacterium]